MTIDVSVVICAYNAANLLTKGVESALSQQGVTLEVILVNDGSTDGTLALMYRLAQNDPRIKVVNNQANLGLAASRNRGEQVAVGEWVCPLDADDWFGEGRLSRLVEAGRRYGFEMVSDDMYFVPQGREHKSKRLLSKKYSDVCTAATLDDFIQMSLPSLRCLSWGYMQPLVRLDFLRANKISYSEELPAMEDWDYWMRCLLQGAKLLVVGEPYYHYLIDQTSLSRAGSAKKRMAIMIEITDTIMDLARNKNNLKALNLLKSREILLRRIDSYLDISAALKSFRIVEVLKVLRRDPAAFPLYALLGFNSLCERVCSLMGVQPLIFIR